MELWLILVIIAQFIFAVVSLIDKYIVTDTNAVPRPLVYAFYVSALSALSILVFLFSWLPIPIPGLEIPSLANVEAPSFLVLMLALVAGYTFFQALVSLFTALKVADASDVVPVVGAVSALATFFLSYLFLGTTLSDYFLYGFLALIAGTLLLSHFRFPISVAFLSLHAGLFFAIHYVAVKVLFNETNFDNGFFWSRMGIVFIALSLLLVPRTYAKIRQQSRATGRRGGELVILNKMLAGLASLLVLKAIDLGDIAIVQALGGLQYVFLLVFGLMLGSTLSRVVNERSGTQELEYRSLGISLIVLGFFLLFL